MRQAVDILALAAALFLLGGAARTAAAAHLAGRIVLQSAVDSLRSDEVHDAVVYFKPSAASGTRLATHQAEIVMRRKEFVPRVVTLTVGSSVRFPNSDPILHNVFSVSGDNGFDLGLYPQGAGKSVTFRHAGLVRVFCNVHHDMVAYVLVLDTPYFTAPAADGAFDLTNLPDSEGLLVVWHERAEPWSTTLRPSSQSEPLEVRLEVTKPLVPPHPDKSGKPYGDPAAKTYR